MAIRQLVTLQTGSGNTHHGTNTDVGLVEMQHAGNVYTSHVWESARIHTRLSTSTKVVGGLDD